MVKPDTMGLSSDLWVGWLRGSPCPTCGHPLDDTLPTTCKTHMIVAKAVDNQQKGD